MDGQCWRKRNAYYQEMGEAYEVIRQEEDYTEPSSQGSSTETT